MSRFENNCFNMASKAIKWSHYPIPNLKSLLHGLKISKQPKPHLILNKYYIFHCLTNNQSGAAEAWWAHNPQVPGSKPGSDKKG